VQGARSTLHEQINSGINKIRDKNPDFNPSIHDKGNKLAYQSASRPYQEGVAEKKTKN
jgi:hypothetical protein